MAKKNLNDSLVRFAHEHGGSLKALALKRGTAYVYVYYENNVREEKYFPAHTPAQKIFDFILLKQGNIYAARNGYEPQYVLEHRARNRLTLAQLLDWYIETTLREKTSLKTSRLEVRLESAKRTARSYEYACDLLEKFLEAELGNKSYPVENLEREHVSRFMRWLLAYDGGRGGFKTNTINDMVGRITAIFRKACYEKKIAEYKFDGLQKLEREPVGGHLIITPEEMKQIGELGYLERSTYRKHGETEEEDRVWRLQIWWAYQIARITAMRAQDIRRLRWQDLDFEVCEYNVLMAKVHKTVRMPFHPALKQYREQYFQRLGHAPSVENIFNLGEKELNHRFRGAIVKLKGETGLSCGSHTFRHSWATYLNRIGWGAEDVGMFLCHDSGNVTHRYTHERVERMRGRILELPIE